jgi:hypothetical protein
MPELQPRFARGNPAWSQGLLRDRHDEYPPATEQKCGWPGASTSPDSRRVGFRSATTHESIRTRDAGNGERVKDRHVSNTLEDIIRWGRVPVTEPKT